MSDKQICQLSQYHPSWKIDFNTEKKKLLTAFNAAALEIEHIGSTAIEGLASKPIIDIAVMIRSHKDADDFTESLAQIGYQFVPPMHPGPHERHFYTKGESIKCHLSVAYTDIGGFWPRQILFRDCLRVHDDARVEYAKLKEELLRKYWDDDTGAYSRGKTEFVYRILKLAGWKVFQKYKLQGSPEPPSVVEVIPREDGTLVVTFDSGDKGVLDIKHHLGKEAFQEVTTYEDLKSVHVANGTIAWDCGVVLDTEYIYERCKENRT